MNDGDYQRIFVSNYQRDILHFYGLGDGIFSAGFVTPDGIYHSGLWRFDGNVFHPFGGPRLWHTTNMTEERR